MLYILFIGSDAEIICCEAAHSSSLSLISAMLTLCGEMGKTGNRPAGSGWDLLVFFSWWLTWIHSLLFQKGAFVLPSCLPDFLCQLWHSFNHMVNWSSSLEWQHTWGLPAYFSAAAGRWIGLLCSQVCAKFGRRQEAAWWDLRRWRGCNNKGTKG